MSCGTDFRRFISPGRFESWTLILVVLGAACTGPARQATPAAGTPSDAAADRVARWTREKPGQPLPASIAFRSLQPDSAIVRLLERYGVRPYVAHAWAGGVETYAQLPPEQANESVVGEARRLLLERLERNTCAVGDRVRRLLDDQAAVRRAPAERERAERAMLARLRAEREALAQARAGSPVVWGVYVIGSPEAVSRLGRDSMVWAFEPVTTHIEDRQTIIGVPRPPEPPPVGELPNYPDIARMTAAEVRAQLETRAIETAPACPSGVSGMRLSGNWVVVARRFGRAVLAAHPVASGTVQRGSARPSLEVVIYERGSAPQTTTAELVPITLPGVPPEQARLLQLGRITIDGRNVYFSMPGSAPSLLPSPADSDLYLFEEANALWAFTPGRDPRRLTADVVGEFDRDRLAARQREGEVILYWATSPVWSPDGNTIAYVTNREAVAKGGRGQAVWLLELAARRERPLLHEPGESFRAIGWLGRELLYTGPPGVGAVDPVRGARHQLARGLELAVAADGSAVALADDVPHATTVQLLSARGSERVPAAPLGSAYAAQAVFSPGGTRLLLLATTADGRDRRFYVYDRGTARLRALRAPDADAPSADWPSWLDDDTLLLPAIDAATRVVTSWIVDVSSSPDA